MRTGEKSIFKIRLTALFLLISFVLTQVPAYAQNPGGVEAQDPHSLKATLPSLAALSLPRELGIIEESHISKSTSDVLIIQDAHAIGEAQFAILKMTEYLIERYGVQMVGLEGASSPLETDFFRSYPGAAALEKTIHNYVLQGEVSGAAAAALLQDRPVYYTGIEDPKQYEEGINLYLEALNAAPRLEKEAANLKSRAEALKQKIYSPEALALDAKLKNLESSKNFLDALDTLKAQMGAAMNPVHYPHLSTLLESEQTFAGGEALEKEFRSFEEKLRKKIRTGSRLEMLNRAQQDYQTQFISSSQYARYLAGEAAEWNLALPEVIARQAMFEDKLQKIKGQALWDEIEAAAAHAKTLTLKSPDEQSLDALEQQILLVEKWIRLELSRKQWKQMASVAAVRTYSPELAELAEAVTGLRQSLDASGSYQSFYENALSREDAMYRRLMEEMRRKKHSRAVIVAGGFHSEGLLEHLKQEGVSYALLTPSITNPQHENHYRDFMRGNVSWKEYFRAENGRIDIQAAFTRAVRDQLLAGSGTGIKSWRDSILRRLAAKKQTARASELTKFLDEKVSELNDPNSREKLKKQWQLKVENFIRGLEKLEKEKRYTVPNLYQLLGQPVPNKVNQYTAVPVAENKVPAAWIGAVPAKAAPEAPKRSEFRAFKSVEDLLKQMKSQWKQIQEKGFIAFDMQKTLTGRKEKASAEMIALLAWLLEQKIRIVINSGNTQGEVLDQVINPLKEYLATSGKTGLMQNITVYANSGTLKMTFGAGGREAVDEAYQESFKMSRELEMILAEALEELAGQNFFIESDADYLRLKKLYEKDAQKTGGKIEYRLWKDMLAGYKASVVDFESMAGIISGPHIQRRGLTKDGFATALAITKFLPETRSRIIDFLQQRVAGKFGPAFIGALNFNAGGESTVDVISVLANKALALVDYVNSLREAGIEVDLSYSYYVGDELTMNVTGELTGETHPGNDRIVFIFPYTDPEFKKINGIAVTPKMPVGFSAEDAERLFYAGVEQDGLEALISQLKSAIMRSEQREVPELLIGLHDKDPDGHFYPDWWVMQVIGQEFLKQTSKKKGSIRVEDIREAVRKRIRGHGFGDGTFYADKNIRRRYSDANLDNHIATLMNRMMNEHGLLTRQNGGYQLDEDPYQFMLKMNDVDHIKNSLVAEIEKITKKSSPGDGLEFLLKDLAAAVGVWKRYPGEAAWPVMKAVTQLSSPHRHALTQFLNSERAKILRDDPLIDAVLYLLTNLNRKDWLEQFAPELVGASVYYISPETWLAAGGLGRVGQYHTVAAKTLMGNSAELITIEPSYSYRVGLDENFNETMTKDIDYSKLSVPVKDLKKWTEFTVYVSKQGKRTAVTVDVERGYNDAGVEVFLYKDRPETEGGDPYFTKFLYSYGFEGNADVEEFTEFASKVSLILTKKIEFEKKKEFEAKNPGQTKKPPVIWANDGQTALVPLFKLISDDLEKMSPDERERVMHDPQHEFYEYRDLIQRDGEISLQDAVMIQTTHTYRNRVIKGPREFVENLKLPKRYQSYLRSGEWLYLNDPRYADAYDATSAGVRAASADLGGANGVALPHTVEVNELDKEVEMHANTNGDTRQATRREFVTAFKQVNPAGDSENPDPEDLIEAKKISKMRLKTNKKLMELNPRLAEIDPEKIVFGYTGRGVDEKVGHKRAFTEENIRALVRAGGQVIILANVQAGNKESKAIFKMLKELEDELFAERAAALDRGEDFGLFVAVSGWNIPEQRFILAAFDIQVNDSDRDPKRGTEAAGVTETDVMTAGGLEMTSPFLEAIFQQQGVILNWDIAGSGNTIIPEGDNPEDYLAAMSRALSIYKKDRRRFAIFQVTSIQLSQILEARFNGGHYLMFANQLAREKKDPNVLWGKYFAGVGIDESPRAYWLRDRHRRYFERLMEKYVRDRSQDEEIFGTMRFSVEDAVQLFNPNAVRFGWWRNPEEAITAGDPGVAGFLETMFRLNSTKPEDLLASLRHHANRGDFLNYFTTILKGQSKAAAPLLAKIEELKQEAAQKTDLDEKVRVNLQAIDLMSAYAQRMASQIFNLRYESSPAAIYDSALKKYTPLGESLQKLFTNVLFNRLVVSHLNERFPEAKVAILSEQGIRIFLLDHGTHSEMLAFNIGAVNYPDKDGEDKAWGKLLYRPDFDAFIDRVLPNPTAGVQFYDPERDQNYGFYLKKDFMGGSVNFGIPGYQRIILDVETDSALLKTTPSKESMWLAVKEDVEAIKQAALKKDWAAIERLLPVSRNVASRRFSPELLPTMMGLIAGLAPQALYRTEKWDPEFYKTLTKIVADNKDIIEKGVMEFGSPSREGVLNFSYAIDGGLNGKNIIDHIHFDQEIVSYTDGKAWSVVRDIAGTNGGLQLDPKTLYRVRGLIEDLDFNPKTGAQLTRHWDIGVPVRDIEYKGKKIQRRLGVGFYQLVPYRPEEFPTPQVTVAPKLKEAGSNAQVYEFNVRAFFEEKGISSFDGITDAMLAEIKAAGFTTLWPMGIYAESPFSKELNEYWGNKENQKGRVASAFAIPDYIVNPALGGEEALKQFALRAEQAGLRVLFDFIPNHVAKDSPLIAQHPTWFIHRTTPPLDKESHLYFEVTLPNGKIIWVAHARDGSDPWADTAQFNLLEPEVWQYFKVTLFKLAEWSQGRGVRADSLQVLHPEEYRKRWYPYMLPADFDNHMRAISHLVFEGKEPHEGANVFGALFDTVKEAYPDFKIIGEVYHGQHGDWQRSSVDVTYAKYVYNWLVNNEGRGWQEFIDYVFRRGYHQGASLDFMLRSYYFLEDHDQRVRLLAALGKRLGKPATDPETVNMSKLLATAIATAPGIPMIYDGQTSGASLYSTSADWIATREQLEEHPETQVAELPEFYNTLFQTTSQPVFRVGGLPEPIPAKGGNGGLLAFIRRHDGKAGVVVLNHSRTPVEVELDFSLIGGAKEKIKLEPWGTFVEVRPVRQESRGLDPVVSQTSFVLPVVTALAAGTVIPLTDAAGFVQQPLSESAPQLREAAANNQLAEIYADNILSGKTSEVFVQAHPSYEQDLADASRKLAENAVQDADAYLTANPNGTLNYEFAVSVENADAASRESLRAYLEAIKEIVRKVQMNYPDAKVNTGIRILMKHEQLENAEWKEFFQFVDASGIAKRIEMNQPDGLRMDLTEFLTQQPRALVYGLLEGEIELRREFQARLVGSQIELRSALPVSFKITTDLAKSELKKADEIREAVLRSLEGYVIWDGDSMVITTDALGLIYSEYLTQSYIATMA